jgi:hypothetical protein
MTSTPATLRRRFHGFTDGGAYTREQVRIGNLLVSTRVRSGRGAGVQCLRAGLSGDDALLAGTLRRIGPPHVSLYWRTIKVQVDLTMAGPDPTGAVRS